MENNPASLTLYAKNLDKEFSFVKEKITLGRNEQCDIVFPSEGYLTRISMKHASFEYTEGSWHVKDENTLYGTRLNGQKLKPKKLYAVSPGDKILLADTEILEIRKEQGKTVEETDSAKTEMNPEQVKKLQGVVNDTYPGLTMYVRDVDLDPALVEKYEEGMIIREKGFVDASCRVMGMVTSHRYAILSNHMANLVSQEQGTNWGLFVANRDSHFKVLGKHTYQNKTVIFLLHLPDDENWKLFRNTLIDLDKDLVSKCIQRFEAKCLLDPVPELTTAHWQQRCRFPVGIDDTGSFFPLEDAAPEA